MNTHKIKTRITYEPNRLKKINLLHAYEILISLDKHKINNEYDNKKNIIKTQKRNKK
jgi:hypothetical protein